MIPQSKISAISNSLAKKGGKRIPENVIERDYCISWFLFGLGQSEFKHNLIFKGGTALRRCYYGEYRFSEDLDFSLLKKVTMDEIKKELTPIFNFVKKESNIIFTFEKEAPPSKNTYTFYLNYKGPLPKNNTVKIDVTFDECFLFDVEEREIIKTYEEYEDFLKATVNCYSLNEIATEKICALFDSARKEPRDLYDIYYLLEEKDLDLFVITDEIFKKMEFKGRPFKERKDNFLKKEKILERLWAARLSYQVTALPPFDLVFRRVKLSLKAAHLLK